LASEEQDGRLHAPAVERNREPILAVLRTVMPTPGTILEIASGSGQHAAWFAPEFPGHRWAPSDVDPDNLSSIDAWCRQEGAVNVIAPRVLDASAENWPVTDLEADLIAMLSVNMIHISPWAAGLGLLAAAGRLLPDNGILFLYGPFLRDGQPATDSDAEFDRSLQARDPSWGLRDLDQVVAAANAQGLVLSQQLAMPVGNLSLIFRPEPR
jgi:hypothetical protein